MFSVFAFAILFPICYAHIAEFSTQKAGRNVFQREARRPLQPVLSIRNSPKEFVEIVSGQTTFLECEAGGTPPPSIYWLKNGKDVPQNMYEALHPHETGQVKSRLGLGFTKSRLFIDCATSADAGVYTCVAENEYTKDLKTSKVSVINPVEDEDTICLTKKKYGSPARVHMWTQTRLELMGTDVQLFCRADGDPQPEVVWIGPDDRPLVPSDRYEVLESGDLVIRKINWGDMGGYICQVSNSEGSDESSVFLYPTLPDSNMKG